jgi:hypothetical protein
MLDPACQALPTRSAAEKTRKSVLAEKLKMRRGGKPRKRNTHGLKRSADGKRSRSNYESRSGRRLKKKSEDGRKRNDNGN